MRRAKVLLPLVAAALCGCDSYRYHSGRFFDETGRTGRAVAALESFIEHRPQDPRACEVRLRLGRAYAGRLGRFLEAQRHFEAAARGFQDQPACVEAAKAGLMDCPDFFPLEAGRGWVFGDTASGGRNMRLEWDLRRSAADKTTILGSLFAGNKRINTQEKAYSKKDWAVWEGEPGAKPVAILRYPYVAGRRWTERRGKYPVDFLIEDSAVEVKTVAGAFSDCLKVRETDRRFKGSWKYDYYCPGVGRVKTTAGSPGAENPNTELIKAVRP